MSSFKQLSTKLLNMRNSLNVWQKKISAGLNTL